MSEFTDFVPKGLQSVEPLHFVYPDQEGKTDPDFFSGVAAGFKYQWLPVTHYTQEYFSYNGDEYDENFDFRKTVQDNDDFAYADELSRAKNLGHYNFIKQSLQAIDENRRMFERAGLTSHVVAGVVDPLNIAFFHPVFSKGIRAAWGAKSAFGVAKESAKVGFVFGVGSEAIRAPFDPYNTTQETLVNIAGNTVFSGLLGGGARGVANRYGKLKQKYANRKNPNKKTDAGLGDSAVREEATTQANDFSKQFVGPTRLKEETIDRFNIANKLLPSRRLQIYGYDGYKVPDEIKKLHLDIAHNASVPVEGAPLRSIDSMQNVHNGKGIALEQDLRKIYMNELQKSDGTGQVMGIDLVTPYVKAKEKLGKAPQTAYINSVTGGTKYPSPQEFVDEMIELNILMSDDKWKAKYYPQLPEFKKEAIRKIEAYNQYFDQLAQDTGAFVDRSSAKKMFPALQRRIDDYDLRIELEKDPIFTKILAINRNKLKERLKFAERYEPTRKNYRMPIYYDVVKINATKENEAKLVNIFEQHFLEQRFVTIWTGNGYKDIGINTIAKANKFAQETVNNIKDNGTDPFGHNTPLRVGKAKHIMARTTNIPEYKVRDFMIKDQSVFTKYAEMMAFRIEYARKFGDDDIEYLVDRIEEILIKDGANDKQIAEIKSDFLADFQRVAGQISRDAERWDTTFARISKKFAGMAYLTSAGITSLTETVAMPILEHGLGNVLRTAFRAVDGDFDKIKANAKDLQHSNEGIDTSIRTVHTRLLNDLLRPLQIGKIEKAADSMENFFYKLNGLALITMVGKLIDSAIRIPKFYKQIKNYNSLDKYEITELQRYGIDDKLAKRLLDNGAWQFTDSDMPLLNLNGWSTKTKADRELKTFVQTYLNNAARNTIMHATAFDRPTFADGFVFKKWKPYMRKYGIEPDRVASVGLQKDGSYRYPIARIESGVMAFPFQFYNFAFAANQRITRAMFDPNKKHRLSGAIALLSMAYITMSMRKPKWWFDDKDYPELITRMVDYSGITGIYSDLAYKGVEAAVASGIHDPDTSWLKGRYKATGWDLAFGFAGATPSMYREWILGAEELINDKTSEGLKRFSYNTPYLGILGLDDDLRALGRATY